MAWFISRADHIHRGQRRSFLPAPAVVIGAVLWRGQAGQSGVAVVGEVLAAMKEHPGYDS